MYVKLKKKFGQNLLIDRNILDKIKTLIPKNLNHILEIGPGTGLLTEQIIIKSPKFLTLVEIDSELTELLKNKFRENKKIKIINSDFLKKFETNFDFDTVVSNLPYNISSQILIKLLKKTDPPNLMILMFQKEFADRIMEKKLNNLNSFIRCFYEVRREFNVSNNCFRPIPKVNSSVVKFRKLKRPLLNHDEIEEYIIFKQKIFSHKRKTLGAILKIKGKFELFNLKERAENLELMDLIKLFKFISS